MADGNALQKNWVDRTDKWAEVRKAVRELLKSTIGDAADAQSVKGFENDIKPDASFQTILATAAMRLEESQRHFKILSGCGTNTYAASPDIFPTQTVFNAHDQRRFEEASSTAGILELLEKALVVIAASSPGTGLENLTVTVKRGLFGLKKEHIPVLRIIDESAEALTIAPDIFNRTQRMFQTVAKLIKTSAPTLKEGEKASSEYRQIAVDSGLYQTSLVELDLRLDEIRKKIAKIKDIQTSAIDGINKQPSR